MAKKKIKPPFEILVSIVDRGDGNKVSELLEENHLQNIVVLQGTGTAESEVAELFGFGVVERDIVVCIVDQERSKVMVELLYTDLNMGIEHSGCVFTISPSSATLELINLLKLEN